LNYTRPDQWTGSDKLYELSWTSRNPGSVDHHHASAHTTTERSPSTDCHPPFF